MAIMNVQKDKVICYWLAVFDGLGLLKLSIHFFRDCLFLFLHALSRKQCIVNMDGFIFHRLTLFNIAAGHTHRFSWIPVDAGSLRARRTHEEIMAFGLRFMCIVR